ncbi:MAG: hypothetical protein LBK00_04525 [Treponema sp.]|jgi:hypothetical protein|nr:hypothetical protein [Treponema sp.]
MNKMRINEVKAEIKECEKYIHDEENGGNRRLIKQYKTKLRNLQLKLCHLKGEEISGLRKDETGYDDNIESCYNCAELLESHLGFSHYCCRLLDDDDNIVYPNARCDFWREMEF